MLAIRIFTTCTLLGGRAAELIAGMAAVDVCSRWESWAMGEAAVAAECEEATAVPARLYPDAAAILPTSLAAKEEQPASCSLS